MIIKKWFFSAILLIVSALPALAQTKSFDILLKKMIKKTVPIIMIPELAKKSEKVILLDARELKEFQVSHLKNAIHIGYKEFDESSLAKIDKNEEIIVYCSIGVRSEKIGERLQSMGFKNVKNLYGSIFEWVNQGHQVYDMNNHITTKVHAYDKKWGVWLKKGEKVY
jgi:rhodanese-related sulfurtransferase